MFVVMFVWLCLLASHIGFNLGSCLFFFFFCDAQFMVFFFPVLYEE